MFEGNTISLVIPVYNEEHSIPAMLSCIPEGVDEVIVVDNGSTDNTVDVCKRFSVSVILEEKKGYGFAYRSGIPAARGDIIIAMDGDNTYPLSEVENLLAYFSRGGYDFLSGCRKNEEAMALRNKIGNVFISRVIRLCFKIRLRDSQSGMWIFRKSIFPRISPWDPGMGFSQEIKIRAWRNPSIKCGEVGIPYKKRCGGKSKFRRLSDSIMVLRNLLSLFVEINGVV